MILSVRAAHLDNNSCKVKLYLCAQHSPSPLFTNLGIQYTCDLVEGVPSLPANGITRIVHISALLFLSFVVPVIVTLLLLVVRTTLMLTYNKNITLLILHFECDSSCKV